MNEGVGGLLTGGIRNVCEHIDIEINRAVLKLILAANERTLPGSLMEPLLTLSSREELSRGGKASMSLWCELIYVFLSECNDVCLLVSTQETEQICHK